MGFLDDRTGRCADGNETFEFSRAWDGVSVCLFSLTLPVDDGSGSGGCGLSGITEGASVVAEVSAGADVGLPSLGRWAGAARDSG